MTMSFSVETRTRIERLAKISGRTPEQVVDEAIRLSEQTLLAHIPPEWRSGYMVGILQYAMVTTPPPKPQKPRHVERDDTYVAYDECNGFVL